MSVAITDAPGGDGWRRLPFGPGPGGPLLLVSGGSLALETFGSLHPLAHEDLGNGHLYSAWALLAR